MKLLDVSDGEIQQRFNGYRYAQRVCVTLIQTDTFSDAACALFEQYRYQIEIVLQIETYEVLSGSLATFIRLECHSEVGIGREIGCGKIEEHTLRVRVSDTYHDPPF